ncbi:MAG TPA: EamA family transporter [Holophagaceae bacterium]|jgi:uncharacterized membrane protein|nr:EamA family transporter [Holophagaceae bacterium]
MAWLGWAFAAFLLMGLANIGMKGAALRGLTPAAVLMGVMAGELPLALAEWFRRGQPALRGGGMAWAVVSGIATGAALIFLNEAFARGAKGGLAVSVMNANFILVALAGWFLFKEGLDAGKLLGLGLTLAGLWLLTR